MLPLTNCESQCGQINQTQSCSAANNRSLLFFNSSLSLCLFLFSQRPLFPWQPSLFSPSRLCVHACTPTPAASYPRRRTGARSRKAPQLLFQPLSAPVVFSTAHAPSGRLRIRGILRTHGFKKIQRSCGCRATAGGWGGGLVPDAETEKTTIHFNESKT